MPGVLPNFVILGAQKAGTTSLLDYFVAHPQVYMSPSRETRFFMQPNQFVHGLRHYEVQHFPTWAGEPAVGEKTPEYLFDPDVPARMRTMLGDEMRYVICLRNPAARAFAGYRQNLMLVREQLDFASAIEAEAERTAPSEQHRRSFGYLARGRYAEQLTRWRDAFGGLDERFLIVDFDDLVSDGGATLAAICAHIGVDARGALPRAGRTGVRDDISVIDRTRRIVRWGGATIHAASDELIEFVTSYRRATASLRPLTAAQVLELNRTHFADDIERLAELVPFDPRRWLTA